MTASTVVLATISCGAAVQTGGAQPAMLEILRGQGRADDGGPPLSSFWRSMGTRPHLRASRTSPGPEGVSVRLAECEARSAARRVCGKV